jgi:hypothetical protein
VRQALNVSFISVGGWKEDFFTISVVLVLLAIAETYCAINDGLIRLL